MIVAAGTNHIVSRDAQLLHPHQLLSLLEADTQPYRSWEASASEVVTTMSSPGHLHTFVPFCRRLSLQSSVTALRSVQTICHERGILSPAIPTLNAGSEERCLRRPTYIVTTNFLPPVCPACSNCNAVSTSLSPPVKVRCGCGRYCPS